MAHMEGSAVITAMLGTTLLSAKVIVKRTGEITINYDETMDEIEHVAGGNLHLFDDRSPAGWLSDGVGVVAVRGQDHSKREKDYNEYLPGFFEEGTYNRMIEMNPNVKLMIGVYYGYKGKTGTNWKNGADGGEFTEIFEEHIESVVREAKEKEINVYSWIPMNEPEIQWNSGDWNAKRPQKFYEVAYKTIKALDPNAKVQGPELGSINQGTGLNSMKAFLLYSRDHECLPDILSWHNLKNTRPGLEDDIKPLQSWMMENDIDPNIPIAVTEYQGTGYKTDDAGRKSQGNYNTGLTTAYLADIERSEKLGLMAGLRSEWGLSGDNPKARGDMGELCDFDTKQMATGLWYVYNAYWDMTGLIVKTNHNNKILDVLATVDTSDKKRQSGILIGNWEEETEYPAVNLENIPSELIVNGKVHVRMEALNETLATPCYGTDKLLNEDIEINENGGLNLYPEIKGRQSVYIVLTPPSEAKQGLKAEEVDATASESMEKQTFTLGENTYVSFAGGKTSSYKDENGDETYVETGDSVTYTMTAEEDGIYNFEGTYVTGTDAGFMQLYLDGKQFGFPTDLYATEAEKLVFDHGNLYLTKGEHKFSFRIVGHGKNAASSAMTLNFMELALNAMADESTEAPEITGIIITPSAANAEKGGTVQFEAEVTGTGAYNESVGWALDGAKAVGTNISEEGLLTVADDETAKSITVTVQSQFNQEIKASALVAIKEHMPEPENKYVLNVVNGSGSGSYRDGTTVEIKADAAKAGMKFDSWKITKGNGLLGDESSNETTFVTADQDSEVTAVYVKQTSSSGGSSSSSSSKPRKQEEKPTAEGIWQAAGDGWKFVKNDGTSVSGWQRLFYNGKLEWYCFAADGTMQTGWFTDQDGEIYYLWPTADGTRGKMVIDWHKIEDKWYYFNPVSNGKRGALYRSTVTPDGYHVDEKGVWIMSH